ncbi:CTP synthase (glutamine hydrolyzing) [Candidatus Pacearchaeota archaeon]|nr:CTP synthase (glutamine hydrolyzing) [Candidatus Pacearchaeota archaeon]
MAEEKEETKEINNSSEFYSPIPQGYEIGKTKYVIITGSVISGIGKGTVSSTLSKNLQDRGLNVEPMKLEAYLNVDSGTLNPFRHGEVFVLDDGTETDLDLGTYERMLDKNLGKDNFITSGRIYKQIIEKERKGDYLGKDVQFIPHVTGEIKLEVRKLAQKTNADIILIEIGGTVGDYENQFAIEALRELQYEEGKESVCFINVTYILEPSSLGEQKSKAAQFGIKSLMQMGIQPDIIICRSKSPLKQSIKDKISLFANIPLKRVFGAHNVKNIYSLPIYFRNMGVDDEICRILKLEEKFPKNTNEKLEKYADYVTIPENSENITIGIAGKYIGASDTYISILNALEHASFATKKKISIKWIDTREINSLDSSVEETLGNLNGLIVPGGFGDKGIEGKIKCIKYCRENNIPFLGLCYGFQLALIEFARNVCQLKNANTTEVDKNTPFPVIDILPEQKSILNLGASMRLGGKEVFIEANTKAERVHNSNLIRRRFRHRYECNPDYIEKLERSGMLFSGSDGGNIMQILELPQHKFFMATQFHPEFTSRPLNPDPLFLEFVKSC